MTLRALAVRPPTVLPAALSRSTPSARLGMAAVPAAFVPIRFPAMRLPVAV
jgi:hypothetical protein